MLIAALLVLLAVDAWLGSVLLDAVFYRGDTCSQDAGADCNDGWLYWFQVVLAVGVWASLLWATWRVWARLHASLATHDYLVTQG